MPKKPKTLAELWPRYRDLEKRASNLKMQAYEVSKDLRPLLEQEVTRIRQELNASDVGPYLFDRHDLRILGEHCRVDIVLDGMRHRSDGTPQATDSFDSRYRPIADISVEGTDAVRVLVDTQRAVSGTDHATGWPCFK